MKSARWARSTLALPGAIPSMSRSSLSPRPDRALVRARAAQAALALALRLAQGKVPAHTKPLAASEQHSAAALDALNEAFLAE